MKKERQRIREIRRYAWIIIGIVVILVTGGIFAVREIMLAQFTGSEVAEQAALDGTILSTIDDVQPYTGGMNGFLFQGKDDKGRGLYVWTDKEKVVALEYADVGLSRDAAIAKAKAPRWAADKFLVRPAMKELGLQPMQTVTHALPGPVLPTTKTEFMLAESKFVWELYGQFKSGVYGYTYLDFRSGDVLWQIALPEPQEIEGT